MWRIREVGDLVDVVKTTVTVYPEEGNFPTIAKALLDVADHPNQVRTVSHPQAGFEVPEEVFDRFDAAQKSSTQQEASPAQTEPPRRRPGRPRKIVEPEAPPTVADASKEE